MNLAPLLLNCSYTIVKSLSTTKPMLQFFKTLGKAGYEFDKIQCQLTTKLAISTLKSNFLCEARGKDHLITKLYNTIS